MKNLLLVWGLVLNVVGYITAIFSVLKLSKTVSKIDLLEANIIFLTINRGQKCKTVEDSIVQFETSQQITMKSFVLAKFLLIFIILQRLFLLPFEILIVPMLSTSVSLFLLGFTLLLDSNIEGLFSPIKMLRNENGKNVYFGQTRLVEYSLNLTFSPLVKVLNSIINAIAHFLVLAPLAYVLIFIVQITTLILPLEFANGCYLFLNHSILLSNKLYNFIFLLIFDPNFKRIQLAYQQIQEEKLTSARNIKIKNLCDKVLYSYVQRLITLFDEYCTGTIHTNFNVQYIEPKFLKCHKVNRDLKETKRFIMEVCKPGLSDKFQSIKGDEFWRFEISKPDFGFDVLPDLFERKVPAITKSIAPPPEEYKINILRIVDEPRLKLLKTAKLFSHDVKANIIEGSSRFFIQAPSEILSQAEVIEVLPPVEIVEEIPNNVIRISNGFSSKSWNKIKNITPRFFK